MRSLLLLAIIFVFAACNNSETNDVSISDSENEEVSTEELTNNGSSDEIDMNKMIVGNWKCTLFQDGEYIFDDSHVFNDDRSFVFDDGSFRAEGTWAILDDVLTVSIGDDVDEWGKIEFLSNANFEVVNSEGKKSVYLRK